MRDVAGDQGQIRRDSVGVIGGGGHRMFMLATEMNVGKLEDDPH
ncbi:hypothetical protein V8F63_05310 [Brevundimonas sp. LF-1]